jgi:uncharacterized protein YdeI (YjbR/CyaY-like superfamily)
VTGRRDPTPVIHFPDAAAFETWLENHVTLQTGVWMKMAKAGSGIASITSDEAVDSGLCFGWISGQRKRLDDTFYLQKYVPRRPRSDWSQVNVRKVEALTAAGRIRPSGQAEVDAAKADGRWDAAYVAQQDFRVPDDVPDDLAGALAADPAAQAAYAALPRTRQYAVVLDVVRGSTAARARRVARQVEILSQSTDA